MTLPAYVSPHRLNLEAATSLARPQRTLARPAEDSGVGVHSGRRVNMRLDPADQGGVRFIRGDLPGLPEIAAVPGNIDHAMLTRMTVLREGGSEVMMIEHLLSACAGLGVDHLRVTLDAPECPIFDGSALTYVRLMQEAGLSDLREAVRPLTLRRPVSLVRDRAEIIAIPANRPRYTYFAEFAHAGMPDEQVTFEPGRDDYAAQVAPARTFVFWEDLEKLRAAGLAQGGSLDCAIVLKDGMPYGGEYRMESELARHKLLDLIGDLAILGAPVNAMISARCSGHAMHQEFARLLAREVESG